MHPLTQKFAETFQGNTQHFGRVVLTNEIDPIKGKRITKNWLEKKTPLTLEVWSDHLHGKNLIGGIPLNEKTLTCVWCAIDVDIYKEAIPLKEINEKINQHKLPFRIFRSKSGAAHIYLFFKSPVKATDIIPKLESFAAYFGIRDNTEIFPKQAILGTLDSDNKYGNWLNLPYGGENSLQYAFDDLGQSLTLESFLGLVDQWKISPEAFKALTIPKPTSEPFPEGPPCLNRLFGDNVTENEMRNNSLSNAAVYWKMANPNLWKESLTKTNLLFTNPLSDNELRAIQNSYEKNDYHYQCSKPPLCNYCDKRTCKTLRFGVAKSQVISSNSALTKLDTDPPIWFLDVDNGQLSLNTDQLYNFGLFAKRHMEVMNVIPAKVKQQEWEDRVNQLMMNVKVISVDPSMTPAGILKDVVEEWINNRASTEGYDTILSKIPYKDATHVFFRMRDLMDYIASQRSVQMKQNEITNIIRSNMKGEKDFKVIRGKGTNLWKLPVPQNHEPIEHDYVESEPF